MKQDWVINIALIIVGIIFAWGTAEIAIRWFGSYDIDGQFEIYEDVVLKPYRLPIERTQQKVDLYLQRAPDTAIMHHPVLGWVPRPHGKSDDGLYQYNGQGIRSPVIYSQTPADNILRIALFGDSFTHCSDVSYEESWGYLLEQKLLAKGVQAEVLNFGVSGYGMDQAYLRWEKEGRAYQPDIVIFGIQFENVRRNVNLIRTIYRRGDIPFSKPRFMLKNGVLKPINIPTIPPEDVPQVMQNIDTWELAKYEYSYAHDDYTPYFWLNSKVLALAFTLITDSSIDKFSYNLGEGPANLTLAIIEQFEQSVQAEGAEFVMVNLLRYNDLVDWIAGKPLVYNDLLQTVEAEYPFVRPGQERLKEAQNLSIKPLFQKGHYSAQGNIIVVEALTAYILQLEKEHHNKNRLQAN
ncbi:SGNH/GDSL hydrolase family protein [Anaerolineales bacterium HSG24]|nr:SGNH/GDSL hydrolase family protein [Anaerolineales bacterium HSG24]